MKRQIAVLMVLLFFLNIIAAFASVSAEDPVYIVPDDPEVIRFIGDAPKVERDLIIGTGDTLIIENQEVIMDPLGSEVISLEIEEGAAITILNSTIRSNRTDEPYKFLVQGEFYALNSTIKNCWGDVNSVNNLGGLEFRNTNATFEGCAVEDGVTNGIFGDNCNIYFYNGTIVGSDDDAIEVNNSYLEVDNSVLEINGWGIISRDSTVDLYNSSVQNIYGDRASGISLVDSLGHISHCSISNVEEDGIVGYRSVLFLDNTTIETDMNNPNSSCIISRSGDITIDNNHVSGSREVQIYIEDCCGIIRNNTIICKDDSANGPDGVDGIGITNSTVDVCYNYIENHYFNMWISNSLSHVTHNVIRNGSYGIQMNEYSTGSIEYNYLECLSLNGIMHYEVSAPIIGNTVLKCGGCYVLRRSDSVLEDNIGFTDVNDTYQFKDSFSCIFESHPLIRNCTFDIACSYSDSHAYFIDCSVETWYINEGTAYDCKSVDLKVVDDAGTPIPDAVVSVYSEHSGRYEEYLTNANGQVDGFYLVKQIITNGGRGMDVYPIFTDADRYQISASKGTEVSDSHSFNVSIEDTLMLIIDQPKLLYDISFTPSQEVELQRYERIDLNVLMSPSPADDVIVNWFSYDDLIRTGQEQTYTINGSELNPNEYLIRVEIITPGQAYFFNWTVTILDIDPYDPENPEDPEVPEDPEEPEDPVDPIDPEDPVDPYDTDNDGLPDQWENQHFGSLYYDQRDDPDHDGWTNIQEYDHGYDPNDYRDPSAYPEDPDDDDEQPTDPISEALVFIAVIGMIGITLLIIGVLVYIKYVSNKEPEDDDTGLIKPDEMAEEFPAEKKPKLKKKKKKSG